MYFRKVVFGGDIWVIFQGKYGPFQCFAVDSPIYYTRFSNYVLWMRIHTCTCEIVCE